MKKRHLSTALLFSALVPHAALAHPGDHSAMTSADLAAHFWSSPFHALFVVLGVLLLAGFALGMRKANPAWLQKLWPQDKTGSKRR